jgi:hypothetical protein
MNDEPVPVADENPEAPVPKPKKTKSIKQRVAAAIRQTVAAIFWAYVVVKLFAFDIDVYLISLASPEYKWILNYKFLFIIGFISAILILTKKTRILIFWSAYILFFPIIFLFWKVPYFVFKQKSWVLAFALINATISFFRSFKYNFISASVFIICAVLVLATSIPDLIWPSISIILCLVLMVYVRRFILVFKPSVVYQLYIKGFRAARDFTASSYTLDESMKNLPVTEMDAKQLQTWTSNLETLVMYNRLALFAGKKLRDYQSSGLNAVSSVIIVLIILTYTILCFSIINYGLYKINGSYYQVIGVPSFFEFIYYSFNKILFNEIREIIPIHYMSPTAAMIEEFLTLFLVVILVSLFFSVKGQRHEKDLNTVIRQLEEQGVAMEGFIRTEYKVGSIDEAMEQLENLQAGMTQLLYIITGWIK